MTKKETAIIQELLQEVKELRKEVETTFNLYEHYKENYNLLRENHNRLFDLKEKQADLLNSFDKHNDEIFRKNTQLREIIERFAIRN